MIKFICINIFNFLPNSLSDQSSNKFSILLKNNCWNNTQTYEEIRLSYSVLIIPTKNTGIPISQNNVKNFCNQFYCLKFYWVENLTRVHCNKNDLKLIKDLIKWINLENLDKLCISKTSWCYFPTWTIV